MKSFVGIEKVIDINWETTEIDTWALDRLYTQQASWVDLVLSLGNSFVSSLQINKFNYYK
jgi:hypothetical protein